MKKLKWLLAIVFVLAAVIAASAVWYTSNHVFVNGTPYPKDAALVDTRDKNITIEEYEQLCAQLPQAEILWNVPVQGTPYPQDAEEVTLTSLSAEGPYVLKYLPNLRTIHAEEAKEYEAITAFQKANPNIHVIGSLALGDQAVGCWVDEIQLDAGDLTELEELMPYLHDLKTVNILGKLPEAEVLIALQDRYPDITFYWNVGVGNHLLRNDVSSVTLTPGDFSEDVAALRYLNHLETVDLREAELSDAQMRGLADAFPDVVFIWNTTLFGVELCTGAEEIDLSNKTITDIASLERELSYFRNLKKVQMHNCGIGNEDMDALNRRHEDVRYVWTVNINGVRVKTDDTTFMPEKERVRVEQRHCYPLRYCTDMVVVDLGHNWVVSCEWAAFMPNLEFLILGGSGISDITPLTGLTKLKYLELNTNPVKDYSPLVTCTALEDLNLGLTYGDPTPIAQMTWLKNLHWCDVGNPLYESKVALDILPDALPNTRMDLTPDHPGAGWWRFLDNYYEMRDLLHMPYLNQNGWG